MNDDTPKTDLPTPPLNDPDLTAYALGELEPGFDAYLAIQAKLESDPQLLAEAKAIAALGEQLRDCYGAQAQPGLAEASLATLSAATGATPGSAATPATDRPHAASPSAALGPIHRILPYAAVAACAAAATATGLLLFQQQGPDLAKDLAIATPPADTDPAAGPDPTGTPVDPGTEAANPPEPIVPRDQVVMALERPISVDYRSRPLGEVLDDLRQSAGVNMMTNWPSLDLVGIDQASPITLLLEDVPIAVVLELTLLQASAEQFDDDKADYQINDWMLQITTRGELKTQVETRVYDITALLGRQSVMGRLRHELGAVAMLRNRGSGGGGLFGDDSEADRSSFGYFFRSGSPSGGPTPIGTPPGADWSWRSQQAAGPMSRVPNFGQGPSFDLNDALGNVASGGSNGGGGGGGGGGLFGVDEDGAVEETLSRRELIDDYTRLIEDTVGDPDEWLDEESTLHEVNGKLVIKTTPNNHAAVEALLIGLDPLPDAQREADIENLAQLLVDDVERGLVAVERRREQREIERQWRERFALITDNPFKLTDHEPLSTFSVDVDTASYTYTRRSILEQGQLPLPDAVRIEEWVNYFDYAYPAPVAERGQLEDGLLTSAALERIEAADGSFTPFATSVEVTDCPWAEDHELVRIGIKGMEVSMEDRPAAHLVFLLDVSGSMQSMDKLPLVQEALPLLLDQLRDDDKVSIVVYAGASGLVLEPTLVAERMKILEAIGNLRAGGSTAGAEGIQLAYQTAADHYIPGGINRVILCTDGDFNVGTSNTGELVKLVQDKANPKAAPGIGRGGEDGDGEDGEGDGEAASPRQAIYLSVMGFGTGNLNDEMMEQITNAGNGNYHYIDSVHEAFKALSQQANGTLVTIAKDVKLQLEFNPARVASYRLIGYENRVLNDEDFNNDTVDAGDIGAGHTVTALYEVVPVPGAADAPAQDPAPGEGDAAEVPAIDPLRYQRPRALTRQAHLPELLTLKLRYKPVDAAAEQGTSRLISHHVPADRVPFAQASETTRFAAAVAATGMILRGSPYRGTAELSWVIDTATGASNHDPHGYRTQFIELAEKARELAGE